MFSAFFCIFIFVVMVVEFVVMQSRATSLVRTNEMLNKRKIETEEENYRCHGKIKVLTSNLKDKTAAIQKRDTVHKEFVRSLRKNSEMIESLIAEKAQLQKQLEEQDDALEELHSERQVMAAEIKKLSELTLCYCFFSPTQAIQQRKHELMKQGYYYQKTLDGVDTGEGVIRYTEAIYADSIPEGSRPIPSYTDSKLVYAGKNVQKKLIPYNANDRAIEIAQQ